MSPAVLPARDHVASTVVVVLILAVVVIAAFFAGMRSDHKTTCRDFETRQVAQAAFDGDRDALAGLDADRDGQACESLPFRT